MLPKNRPPSQSSMCGFLFYSGFEWHRYSEKLGCFLFQVTFKQSASSITPHPLLSILYPPKKQKIGCFPLQVTSKLFERKPTSMPSQKRGNLGVFRSKSPPSYSRGNQHQFPPKKEVTWVFSAASHIQAIERQ